VRPKWFLRLWCIWRKLCTYLAPKLTLSLNGPKRDSIWHTSSRSSIGCVQIWFLSIWYVPCKPCTYLASRLAPSPRSNIGCVQNGFLAYGALGANCAPNLHWNLHSPYRPNEIPYDTRHLGVPMGASKLISEHMVRFMQIEHLSCIKISTFSKQTKPSSLEPLHLWVPIGAFKMVS
jgi:hypothetical protein